ncbi:hypothetical protein D0862_11757 [Hortaea werneckii]|uniref:Uncharacterized protein n=1 Tax=Hortaea werneckii TaxID=91943 RepID=A0A3M7F308_HORWE|nr:hypothetical protein D0862_11757 [Hortaea werneckii]
MSHVHQEQHHQSTSAINRQKFPTDHRDLLAQYMDQCDRMTSPLTSLKDDVRDNFEECSGAGEELRSVGEVFRSPAHEMSSMETAGPEGVVKAIDGAFESPGGRISRLGDGSSIAEGSGSQNSKKEAQSKQGLSS